MRDRVYSQTPCLILSGFGNVILKTSFGRLCAVLYALIGIPLSVLLYVHIGRLLNEFLYAVMLKVHTHFRPTSQTLSAKTATKINALFVFMTGTVLFILLPSLAIHIIEDGWTYAEACYFAFTTIATIGFGDYVAGEYRLVLTAV